MNIIEAMNKGQALLDEAGIESPQLESGMLMAHLLQCPRAHLYINRDRVLTEEDIRQYFDMVAKRVKGFPIHYIVGYREFMGLDFYVNKNVLIPRPDTEVLVEYLIEYGKSKGLTPLKILEIGTGSGAIAVSLAKYIDNSLVVAVDIDDSALLVARKNAIAHGVGDKVTFIQGDLFAPLKNIKRLSKFDIMVSNPPYIPSDDIKDLQSQVKDYEPLKALDGGKDGLDFYRRLAKDAPAFLIRGGLWAVEVGYNQADRVADILMGQGYYDDIQFIKDMAGYNRVVTATCK